MSGDDFANMPNSACYTTDAHLSTSPPLTFTDLDRIAKELNQPGTHVLRPFSFRDMFERVVYFEPPKIEPPNFLDSLRIKLEHDMMPIRREAIVKPDFDACGGFLIPRRAMRPILREVRRSTQRQQSQLERKRRSARLYASRGPGRRRPGGRVAPRRLSFGELGEANHDRLRRRRWHAKGRVA